MSAEPSPERVRAVGFADKVMLLVGREVRATRARDDLAEASAWAVPANGYAARQRLVSAVDALADAPLSDLVIALGPHGRCADPPSSPPAGVVFDLHVVIEPHEVDSCADDWFGVDLFLRDSLVVAVALEFAER